MPSALFIHNGTPGRFEFLAKELVRRGWSTATINDPGGLPLPGGPTLNWKLQRGSTRGLFLPATRAEIDLLRGHAAAECALQLKGQGFQPDLIIGHPGWGEMVFLRELFPGAPQIQIGEFYYQAHGADVGFDPEFSKVDVEEAFRVHAKNAVLAMCLAEAERIVSPTPFQASLMPETFRARTRIIHEGVDTALALRNPEAELKLKSGAVLNRKVPVITYVSRRFEPLRGFHSFMRALPRVLDEVPQAHVVLVGSDSPKGYGPRPPEGKTWVDVMVQELGGRLDPARVHFTGPLDYARMTSVLSVSTVHAYLTYPFVLSWSLLDAMACECVVVGSDTAPVRDVIETGVNGLLVDFFDIDGLAERLIEVCRKPKKYAHLGRAARETVLKDYDREAKCQPMWLDLVEQVMGASATLQ